MTRLFGTRPKKFVFLISIILSRVSNTVPTASAIYTSWRAHGCLVLWDVSAARGWLPAVTRMSAGCIVFLGPLAAWLSSRRETSWDAPQRWEWARCVAATAWFSAGVLEAGGSDTKPGALLQQLMDDTVQSRRTGLRVREGAHPPGPQIAELAGPRAHSGLLVPISSTGRKVSAP